jgi:hypothetical protein
MARLRHAYAGFVIFLPVTARALFVARRDGHRPGGLKLVIHGTRGERLLYPSQMSTMVVPVVSPSVAGHGDDSQLSPVAIRQQASLLSNLHSLSCLQEYQQRPDFAWRRDLSVGQTLRPQPLRSA